MKRDEKARLEAKAAGLLFYIPAAPCRNGHEPKRRVSTNTCVYCEIGYIDRYKAKDKYNQCRVKISSRNRATIKGRARSLFYAARNRALAFGMDFDLVLWAIEFRLHPLKCEITGLPLDLQPSLDSKYNPWAPSIDRTDPRKGYTFDNVKIVCNAYNIAKNQWTESTLMVLVDALSANKNQK